MTGIVEVTKAAEFAAAKHCTQRRKGASKEPYVNHVLEVARLTAGATEGSDVSLVVAALLHDTIEDTGTGPEEIAAEFGQDVLELVMQMTDDKSLPKAERKQLQIEHAPGLPSRAKILKIADKVSNLRSMLDSPPEDWSLDRRRQYFLWARDVVNGCRGANARLEEQFDHFFTLGMEQMGQGGCCR